MVVLPWSGSCKRDSFDTGKLGWIGPQGPAHTTERSFNSQAMQVIDVFGILFFDKVHCHISVRQRLNIVAQVSPWLSQQTIGEHGQ